MATQSLEALAKAIPLTEREVELAKERVEAKLGTVTEVVDGLLDERVGPSARGMRHYPALADIKEGWENPVADEGEQPPAQAPDVPSQVPLTDPSTGERLVPESQVDQQVEDAVADATASKSASKK